MTSPITILKKTLNECVTESTSSNVQHALATVQQSAAPIAIQIDANNLLTSRAAHGRRGRKAEADAQQLARLRAKGAEQLRRDTAAHEARQDARGKGERE